MSSMYVIIIPFFTYFFFKRVKSLINAIKNDKEYIKTEILLLSLITIIFIILILRIRKYS
jgi:hypothetical protein